jgi:hypothetical protein
MLIYQHEQSTFKDCNLNLTHATVCLSMGELVAKNNVAYLEPTSKISFTFGGCWWILL